MQVIEVQRKKEVKSFTHLPFLIYKDDRNWIPHLKQDLEKVFDPSKNKLFRNGELKRWILQDEGGQVIGRIAAFVNKRYSAGMKQPTGGIGFYECINSDEASRLLIDQAINWLKECGMEAADGPINFGEKNMFWGLLIENFEDMPSYGMNYNPAYYKKHFENYGFKIFYEQLCYKRDLYVPAQEVFVQKSERIKSNPDYTIRNVRGVKLEKVAEYFLTVYNNAWGGHHGFKSMNKAQAQKVMAALKPVLDPDIVVFVFHKEKPIGFYVNIPELNEIFRFVKGNLNALGKLKFLYHKWRKTPKTMVGIVFGVDRDYHGKGIEGAIVKWTEEHIVTLKRYDETILTWIGDFNPKMIKVSENLGATCYRKLATYRLLFDSNQSFQRAPIMH